MLKGAPKLNKLIVFISIVATVFLLNACQNNARRYNINEPSLPCKVGGASDEVMIKMQQRFEKIGVRIITVGQNYLISVPASMLFTDQSPRILWGSYGLLNNIACYLKQYRTATIYITNYSSHYCSKRREKALTISRSRGMIDYLWSQGVDTRIMVAQGSGSDKPMMLYKKGGDDSPNARAEITFRRLIK